MTWLHDLAGLPYSHLLVLTGGLLPTRCKVQEKVDICRGRPSKPSPRLGGSSNPVGFFEAVTPCSLLMPPQLLQLCCLHLAEPAREDLLDFKRHTGLLWEGIQDPSHALLEGVKRSVVVCMQRWCFELRPLCMHWIMIAESQPRPGGCWDEMTCFPLWQRHSMDMSDASCPGLFVLVNICSCLRRSL